MKYLIYLLTLLVTLQLKAQPGFLDHSFGNAGIALGFFPQDYNGGYGVFQQSDGKLLNVGTISQAASYEDFYILRYLPDGTIDSSFGTNGIVTDSIGSRDDQAFDVIELANLKILVVGSYDNPIERDVFIRRYDSSGILDMSFGNNGMVTTDLQNNSDDAALRVKVQPDGKILVCGSSTETVNYTVGVMVIRYNTDGTLDSTFGTGGKVLFDQLTGDQAVAQFTLQPDGKIIFVGVTEDFNGFTDILVVRFLPDGSLDSSFNADGIFTFDLNGDDDECWAIALQPDGKILLGGLGLSFNGEDDLLIRLDSIGNLDTSFNSTGILLTDYNLSYDYITGILVQPDGKIVTIGQSTDLVEKISLARYSNSGSDDISFGNNGNILHSLGNDDSYSISAILQFDNRIVITGWIETTTTSNNFIARFENDSLITTVHELKINEQRLYPVPTNDKIYIANFKPGSYVTIFDSQGRIVYQNRTEINSLDVSFLTKGIYLLRMKSDNEQFVQRFIKI